MTSEAELRHNDRQQFEQQYSYDLTARLSYFIISAELLFCGYILLNAETFGVIEYSRWLYLCAGTAALTGMFWRAAYNESFHERAHGDIPNRVIAVSQKFFYFCYVSLSISFFILMIVVGFLHLSSMAESSLSRDELTSSEQVE